MAKQGAGEDLETGLDLTQAADFAPGVTLAEYVDYLQWRGRTALTSPRGDYAWIVSSKGMLERFPPGCTRPAEPADIRRFLKRRGVWMVNYMREGDEQHPPNCFDYVCSDPNYALENLSSHARRDTRRGLRSFSVRLCTSDELAEKGAAARTDTRVRHRHAAPGRTRPPSVEEKERVARFRDVWGAWDGDDLAAWMTVLKIDDWALISAACSCTSALKGCPNNALSYVAARRYMVEEKRRYVSYGLSFVQIMANDLTMHKFKTRMGYEAKPRHRAFVPRRVLTPILATRPGSWTLEKLARVFLNSYALRRLAGLSRLMSGREEDPLAWAREA